MSCVSGSGRPQPYVQLVLAEELRADLQDAGLRERVSAELGELLGEVNQKIEHHERLAFIVVSTSDWTIGNGMLTPTMKIRRSAIEDATEARVDEWYDANQDVVWA